jgi:hypothetical protein
LVAFFYFNEFRNHPELEDGTDPNY